METMHSKLIRLQTALLTLVLLFTVLVPVSAYAEGEPAAAQATADGTKTSDPDTFNKWEFTQAYNNATTGRIWADKTVEDGQITFSGDLADKDPITMPDGADFLVALSALSSYESTTTTDTQALDIVMVLDASGGMKNPMGGGDRTKRITALKTAVGAFIDKTEEKNGQISEDSKKIRLSIVKFAGDSTSKVGNDTYKYLGNKYNYSQIVKELTVCENNDAAALKDEVNKIQPGGVTRADYGMKHAQTVLSSARTGAKKVVIFFTDGKPNDLNGFDNDIASSAIATAKSLKEAGAVVYTVGIFKGADPAADVSAEETSKTNKYMQAVSSNYPNATYPKTSSGWFEDTYSWNFGTRPANTNYYLAASNATELNKVFADIFKSVSTKPAGPTHVTDKPQNGGYVTFDDTLGDYMKVNGFEAVAFAKNVFTDVTQSTSGNVDTYTFKGTHDGTVSGAYPDAANLADIKITVTHRSGAEGDHVRVMIPASMLPLRYYKVTNTDNTPKLEVNNAQPISVIYSVCLKDGVHDQVASGSFTDPDLAAYVAENATPDGEISFYSNKFDENKKTADKLKTIGSTTATFTPATSNSFYYHTENTLLYTKNGDGENATYTPATEVEPGKPYYYELKYLHLVPPEHTQTVEKTDYVPISIATKQEITDCIIEKDGKWYIKAGIKKGSLPSAIDSQLGDKKMDDGVTDGNLTGTAQRRIDFQWNLQANEGVLYLGNNGKLTMNAKGGLKVTKEVTADAGLKPNLNTDFTMKFTLTDKDGQTLDPEATYNYTVTDANGTKVPDSTITTIKSGDEFKLKNGQTAEIVGLPAGSHYTITEPSESLPKGYTPSYTNDTGEVTAGTAQEVKVTNTYAPAEIEVKPTDKNYPFKGVKILTGRNWGQNDHFDFKLVAVDGAPLKNGYEYIPTDVRYTEGHANDGDEVPFKFNQSITFTKPGKYVYNITENIPTVGKIPGVSYDSSFYRVTVTITDDGSGKLIMQRPVIEHVFGNDKTETAETVTFTNTFKEDTETLNIEATKVYQYNDENNDKKPMDLAYGQFHFKLEPAPKDETGTDLTNNPNIPMPDNAVNRVARTVNHADGTITFDDITYTTDNANQTYYYLLTEEKENTATITYSTEKYLIKAEVSDRGTQENPLSVKTTYFKDNNGTWESVHGSKLIFTNTFTGTATATLGVSKSISGRDWKEGDAFTFTLKANGEAPMPANKTIEVTGSQADKIADFDIITYKKAGTYTYTISETEPTTIPGMTKAADVTATVKVTLGTDNNLHAKVEYSNQDPKNKRAEFVNTYNAKPCTVPAKELFKVEKELKGRNWNADTFRFTLTAGDGNPPMPTETTAAVDELNKTAAIGGDQQLEFSAADTYVYYISEENDHIPGITYDQTRYKVEVTVKDEGNGELTLDTIKYYKSNGENSFSDTAESANVAKFVNTYSATAVNVPLTATKKLNVNVGNRTLNEGEFSFTLSEKPADGTVPDAPITATNKADGSVEFNLTFTKAVGERPMSSVRWITNSAASSTIPVNTRSLSTSTITAKVSLRQATPFISWTTYPLPVHSL